MTVTHADRRLAAALVDRARDPDVSRDLVEYEVAAALAAQRSEVERALDEDADGYTERCQP